MAKLLQCTSLISLNAEIWDLAAGGFLPFNTNKFPFLRTLQLPFCNMSSEDLKAIANGCPNLEVLRIDSNRSIENSGVSAICRSDSKLEFLNLLNIPYLSDPALIALAELPALKTLYIGVMHEATENGLMAFARGRSATSLDTLVLLPTLALRTRCGGVLCMGVRVSECENVCAWCESVSECECVSVSV